MGMIKAKHRWTGHFVSDKKKKRKDNNDSEDSIELEVTTCPYCGAKLMLFDSKTKICGNCRKKI